MKRDLESLRVSAWSVVLSFSLLFLGARAARAAQRPSTPAAGHTSGVVSDSGGRPLALAFVTLSSQPPKMNATVITGKDGSFAVDLPAGTYRVIAELRGYAASDPQLMQIQASQKAALKIALQAASDPFDLESHATGAELSSLLSEQARQTLLPLCASCHGLATLAGKRMSRQGWLKIVERMSMHLPESMRARAGSTALAPWETDLLPRIIDVLAKSFGPGKESYRYDPFPINNTPENLSKVVIKEYLLSRPEISAHDITLDISGKRIWYDDAENALIEKKGFFGWYDPATGESKEYRVPQCHGFSGAIASDRAGRVWVGCPQAVAYWSPDTDQLSIFPLEEKRGMFSQWGVDSQATAFSIFSAKQVEPDGDPKLSYIGKFNTQTRKWTLYKVPTPWGKPYEEAADSKNNVWFTEIATDQVGKLDAQTGKITEYPLPTKGAAPRRISIDSKDNPWFSEFGAGKIGTVDAKTGQVTEYEIPTPYSVPYACGVDKNDVVWFSEINAQRLGRFDPKTKTFREYPIPKKLFSSKKFAFTYSAGKETVWGSDITGPRFLGIEVPAE